MRGKNGFAHPASPIGPPGTIDIFSDGTMTSYVIGPREVVFTISPKVPSHIRALAHSIHSKRSANAEMKLEQN